MRQLTILCLVLLLSGLAAAQVMVVGGYAGDWSGGIGVYAIPFVPRITTPSFTLESVSPNAVGASNATFGNVAGATNATLSLVNQPPVGVFTKPVWYQPTDAMSFAPWLGHRPPRAREEHERSAQGPADVGPAPFQSTIGIATLYHAETPGRKASRTYTNADIDRFNQATGNVKWDSRSEQIK